MSRYDPLTRPLPLFNDTTPRSNVLDEVFGDAFGNTDYEDYDLDWDDDDLDDMFREFRRPPFSRSRAPYYYDSSPYGGYYSLMGPRRRRRLRWCQQPPLTRWPVNWDTERGQDLDWRQDEDKQQRGQRQLAVQQRPEEGRSGVSRIRNTRDKYQISIDVHHFKPEEITIRTTDNWINIEANHEERGDEHGYIKRHFRRRYLLPDNVKPEKVSSKLSPDGVLTIVAPKETYGALEGQERDIPVQYEGPRAVEGGKGRREDVDIPIGGGKLAGEASETRGGEASAVA